MNGHATPLPVEIRKREVEELDRRARVIHETHEFVSLAVKLDSLNTNYSTKDTICTTKRERKLVNTLESILQTFQYLTTTHSFTKNPHFKKV